MEINTKIKYYQTYSILLDIDYANLKETRNEEYGNYCLKNGVKLYDFSNRYLYAYNKKAKYLNQELESEPK